jgi:hypothetical protein
MIQKTPAPEKNPIIVKWDEDGWWVSRAGAYQKNMDIAEALHIVSCLMLGAPIPEPRRLLTEVEHAARKSK